MTPACMPLPRSSFPILTILPLTDHQHPLTVAIAACNAFPLPTECCCGPISLFPLVLCLLPALPSQLPPPVAACLSHKSLASEFSLHGVQQRTVHLFRLIDENLIDGNGHSSQNSYCTRNFVKNEQQRMGKSPGRAAVASAPRQRAPRVGRWAPRSQEEDQHKRHGASCCNLHHVCIRDGIQHLHLLLPNAVG